MFSRPLSSQMGARARIRPATFLAVTVLSITILVSLTWSLHAPVSAPNILEGSSSIPHPVGLQLDMSLNSTSLRVGEALQIQISELNLLQSTNKVTASNNWQYSGLGTSWCSFLPIGFAILKGYQSQNTLSRAEMLPLYPTSSFHSCPAFPYVESWNFAPHSSNASINWFGSLQNYSIKAAQSFTGPWPGQNTQSQCVQSQNGTVCTISVEPLPVIPFSPGAYTVVGGDEWGGLLILYFTVT